MNEVRDYKNALTAPEVRDSPNGGRMITGYGIVFNSDSENLGGFIEQVDPGAVTKTLREADIRGIANHNTDWTLGRVKAGTMRLSTDSRGVRYEIDVNPNDPDGQRALAKVERGDWDGSSFCFETVQEAWDWDAQPARRRLLEIKLVEMGPVAFPAYPDSTAAARALQKVAAKLGHKPERMAEALKTGEIRSLIERADFDETDTVLDQIREAAEQEFGTEERVGKTISAATMAKLRAIQEQLNAIMGEAEPEEPDADMDDDMMRAITTESFTGEKPGDEEETPEDKADPVATYRAKLALRKHSVSDLFAKYEIASVAEDTL